MRIAFLVDDLELEKSQYTTLRLAMAAANRGHEVWFIGAGDFAYDTDEKIRGWARTTLAKKHKSTAIYLKELKSDKAKVERITVDNLDILMLRNDPARETGQRAWAKTAGIIFGNVALRSGVVVLNDPTALAGALAASRDVSERRRRGKAARERIVAEWTLERQVDGLLAAWGAA